MKLSIVIPCYNVISYLPECIDSVLKQLTDQVEVIVVNDGSTDGSDILLQGYEGKHPNLKIVHKKNGGLSTARNEGFRHASGDYMAWLDGDDLYKEGVIKKILACLKKNDPDLLIVNFERIWDDNGVQLMKSIPQIKNNQLLDLKKNSIISKIYDHGEMYIWRYIFRREYYHKACFPEGFNFEDVRIFPHLISQCNSCFYLPLTVVSYRQRSNSILKTKSKKNVLDLSSANRITDASIYEKFTHDDKVSFSIFGLKTFVWSTADALQCPDSVECLESIVGTYRQNVLLPLDQLMAKFKENDRRNYIIFRMLSMSDFLYLRLLSWYKNSSFVTKVIQFIYRLTNKY